MDMREVDELFNGELRGFEHWFIQRQRENGGEGAPLVGAERGILKTYFLYATTVRRAG